MSERERERGREIVGVRESGRESGLEREGKGSGEKERKRDITGE